MITLRNALRSHQISLIKYGGGEGIRDEGALLAAISRPYATFDQQDLYPTAIEKATAIFESLIINHPFIDGNKRTAYLLMKAILKEANLDIMAYDDEKYQMTIAASCGEIRFDEIKAWIAERLVQINP